ncbi:MAG: serine/threonine protein kinase [Planctomycetes bacterium]|nr:serine/threonine protein kinase [Planctomycetota bacterium]
MTANKNIKILEKGEIVNETYRVDFFIGQGAFGEVYRVKHKFFDDFQVMKVLKNEYIENADIDGVTNEARILAKLTHPNIVRVFNVNTFTKRGKQHFFITMGFVSGESLSQLLRRKIQLPVSVARALMIDVLRGLDYAHSHNPTVIHRDINSDNILLSYGNETPVALLGDFGISMLLGHGSKLAGAGGRYLYFAPECFWNCYLPSSDVFSAGVVFYKMLTGVHPWEYDFDRYRLDNPEDVAKMINSGRKEPCNKPSLFNQEIDKTLESIILKSLENNMENRYRTAGEFLKALEDTCNTETLPENYWR